MSYQVLARKWRPQVFEDVVGQKHITKTLQNAIATNRLAHAFLFSGPRGVGKTTTARILAKALNCKEGPTPEPCGKCTSCLETAAGTAVDVIEIDGASNRGIEHIRELRETVKYAPAGGKYKVYVIDEVHMLTNEAFNALLKTLEEPPPHVIFIFATTEPQKIPATIHSRCQRYGFKRVSLQDITDRLRMIAEAEGIKVSDQGLAMIARAAEGSMRDSQSLLDQAVSYSGLSIKDEDLQSILGAVGQEMLNAFAALLLSRDAAGLLRQVDLLLEQGQDMRQFLSGLVEHFRNLIVVKIAQEPAAIIELPASDIDRIRNQAEAMDRERLILLFDSLSRTLEEMRWSPHQRFTLEIGLIKACSTADLKPLAEILDRMSELEARLAAGEAPGRPDAMRERATDYKASKKSTLHTQEQKPSRDVWEKVLSIVRQKRMGLSPVLAGSRVLEAGEETLTIGIQGGSFQKEVAEKKENSDFLEQTASEVLNRPVRMTFRLLTEEKQPAKPSAQPKKTASRAADPVVKDVLDIFGGSVVDTENSG